MIEHLLPSSASPQEIAMSEAIGTRIEGVPIPIAELWNPRTCPVELLPWLAWACSLDTWDETWDEATKRSAIAASYAVHSRKGTPGAIKRGLQSIGFGGADITEGFPPWIADGRAPANHTVLANGLSRWAEFAIALDLGDSRGFPVGADAAVREQIARWKPARSHLQQLSLLLRMSEARPDGALPADTVSLRERLALYTERDGPLPIQAGALDHYRADGTVPADGSALVGGHWPYSGAIAGPSRDAASIVIKLQALESRRHPKLIADGSASADGAYPAGYIGPIDLYRVMSLS